jgi:hypothetical protein
LLGKEKEPKKAKGKKEKYVKPSDIACTALDTYMGQVTILSLYEHHTVVT